MNNIERIFHETDSFGTFASGYFNYLKKILDSLDKDSLNLLVEEFEDVRNNGSTLFVAGNGGSASTATTMAMILGLILLRKRGPTDRFDYLL